MATLNRVARRGERGQAIIELALTLPLLMLVLLGIFDFGMMFERYEVVTNAAREGARLAVLPAYTVDDAKLHARNYLAAGGVTGPTLTVDAIEESVQISATPLRVVKVVTVSVAYDHRHMFVGPIMALFGGSLGSTRLTAVSKMRKEGT